MDADVPRRTLTFALFVQAIGAKAPTRWHSAAGPTLGIDRFRKRL